MASFGRPKAALALAPEERDSLQRLQGRQGVRPSMRLRIRIVIACASGLDNVAVAEELGISPKTVGKWRSRFIERGAEGLIDEARTGRPRLLRDEDIGRIVDLTLNGVPTNARRWSVRHVADQLDVTKDTVHRVWTALGLGPESGESACGAATTGLDSARAAGGLFLSGGDCALALSGSTQPLSTDMGQVHALLPSSSPRGEDATPSCAAWMGAWTREARDLGQVRHPARRLRSFLDALDRAVPEPRAVHVVLNNYVCHRTDSFQRWLKEHARFRIHFTPTHRSWLGQVQRLLTGIASEEGGRRSLMALETEFPGRLQSPASADRVAAWVYAVDRCSND